MSDLVSDALDGTDATNAGLGDYRALDGAAVRLLRAAARAGGGDG